MRRAAPTPLRADDSPRGGQQQQQQHHHHHHHHHQHDSIFGSLKTICVLLFWFACTVSVLLHNKTVLNAHILSPLQITFGQSTVGLVADLVVLLVCGCLQRQRQGADAKGNYNWVARTLAGTWPSRRRRRELSPLCVAFVLTKLLTLYSIALIPASLTYTIKATSPIFTVLFAYAVIGKVFSWQTYLSLVPITAGVAMSATSSFDMSMEGLVYAVTSVGMGVGYQMYMKSLMDKTGAAARAAAEAAHAHTHDVVTVASPAPSSGDTGSGVAVADGPDHDSSSSSSSDDDGGGGGGVGAAIAALNPPLTMVVGDSPVSVATGEPPVLLPAMTTTAAPTAAGVAAAAPSSSPMSATGNDSGQGTTAAVGAVVGHGHGFYTNFVNTTILHVQIAAAGMIGTLLISVVQSAYSSHQGAGGAAAAAAAGGPSAGTLRVEGGATGAVGAGPATGWAALLMLLLENGLYNHGASLSSYLLLSLTSNLTWQIANAMKRLVVIVASVVYFRTPLTTLNVVGVGMAIAGVSVYESVRKPARPPLRRRGSRSNSELELASMPSRPQAVLPKPSAAGGLRGGDETAASSGGAAVPKSPTTVKVV